MLGGVLVALATACGSGSSSVPVDDAGGGTDDLGKADAGPADTGPADTGPTDTGPSDTGPMDTGPADAGPEDVAPTDAGPMRCTSATDCAGNAGGPACDTTTGRCVPCTTADDRCPSGQYCTADNACAAGCRDDAACMAGDAGTGGRCDTATRQCVACVTNDHCAAGTLCVGNVCVMGCNTERPCPSAQTCCDGACVDTQSSIAACGACSNRCNVPNAMAACTNGTCTVGACTAPFANCDGMANNGCETNTQTDTAHCGACGTACATRPNATASCTGGMCAYTCAAGFADCDNDPGNGCEVDTRTSTAHCGACGRTCNPPNATAVCAMGQCGVAACAMGFGNCDDNPTNGCETDTRTSTSHCGACGTSCPGAPNAVPACAVGMCALTCTAGFSDCDGNTSNGCEADTRTSAAHCGGCGRTCGASNSTLVCMASTCTLTGCAAGFADCDSNTQNGCETSTQTSVAHCGGCGMQCPARPNTAASCAGGACQYACAAGFNDCDDNPSNGCETQGACVYSACSAVPRTRPSGVYTLNSGGSPWQAYCDMTTDGGGWTLLLKVDGAATTFQYDSALWTNTALLNESATNTTRGEAKFRGFLNLAFTAVRVVMRDGADRGLTLPLAASSLQSLFAGGARSTTAGRGAWRGLVSSPSLQPFCNAEGVNQSVPGYRRVRLGILTNQENECGSPDSGLGVGFGNDSNGCVTSAFAATAAGNVTTCGGDDGDRNTQLFTMLFVR